MALQHLRSNTASKRPTAGAMSEGQIAINTNATSPGLFFKDAGGAVTKVGPVHVGTSAPNSSPAGSTGNSVGEQWLDTSGGGYVLKIWDGSAWRSEVGEFVDAAGDTMTGDLVMNNANIVFEGSTDDGFETTLTVTDPTADRTITLPNVTGTVVTTGDTGTVTSTMIADGTIVNADINASAAIALSKLATGALPTAITVASANIVDGTIVNADVNASAAIAGTKIDPDFGSQTIETTGVFSAAGGAAATPSITFTGDLNTGIYSPGADQVAISTSGTQRINIEADGDINIDSGGVFYDATNNRLAVGTTAPPAKLTVSTSSFDPSAGFANWSDEFFAVSPGGTSTSGGVGIAYDSTNNIGSIVSALPSNSWRDLKYIAAGHRFEIGGSEKARIDSSGRLLVGTSSAQTIGNSQAQLEVSTDSSAGYALSLSRSFTDIYGPQINFRSTRGTAASPVIVDNDDQLGSIAFYGYDGSDSNNQFARIAAFVDGTPGADDCPGRLVFSTTADGASSPTERMRIGSNGTISTSQALSTTTVFSIRNETNSGSQTVLAITGGTYTLSDTTSKLIKFSRNDGTEIGSVIRNGTTTVNYATSSDYRLKENIAPLSDAVSKVNALNPSRFNFIGDTRTVDGFIAHEIQSIVPEAVTGEKDAVDADGNPIYQGIDQSKLVPLLTAALQEAIGEIESLKARVAALEAN